MNPAVNRTGLKVDCTVRMSPLSDSEDTIGAILVMEGA